jgi:hypothetical protein
MACSNARSGRLSAVSDRSGKTAGLALLFLFVLAAPSARAQFVEDVFTTPSYDIECTFTPSAGPELSCDWAEAPTLRSCFEWPRAHVYCGLR